MTVIRGNPPTSRASRFGESFGTGFAGGFTQGRTGGQRLNVLRALMQPGMPGSPMAGPPAPAGPSIASPPFIPPGSPGAIPMPGGGAAGGAPVGGVTDPLMQLFQALEENPALLADDSFFNSMMSQLPGEEGAQTRVMTEEEKKAAGLPKDGVYQIDAEGNITTIQAGKEPKQPTPKAQTMTTEQKIAEGFDPRSVVQIKPNGDFNVIKKYEPPPDTDKKRTIKPADSNAIRGAVADLFGGTYDPVTGRIIGLGKEEAQNALSISEHAEQIMESSEGDVSGSRAVAQAARAAGIVVPRVAAIGGLPGNIPTVNTQAEVDKLDPGTTFIWGPTGQQMQKE